MNIQELFDDESKWTKEQYAKNKEGFSVRGSSQEACCWCLNGAIYICYPKFEDRENVIALICSRLGTTNIAKWNDDPNRKFSEVKELVKSLGI